MRDTSSALTIANAGILVLMLLFLIWHGIGEGVIIDRITPVFFWVWLIGTPFLGAVAYIASTKAGKRSLKQVNGLLVFIWAIGLVISMFLY